MCIYAPEIDKKEHWRGALSTLNYAYDI